MNLPLSTKILPRWRHWSLFAGTLLALSVYYLNYGATFDEGSTQGVGPLTLLLRICAISLIVVGLLPLRSWTASAWMSLGLHVYGAIHLLIASIISGTLNDSLFFNTLIQLPVLIALLGTHWQINHGLWLKFICKVLAIQVLADSLILKTGHSLWLSEAFIGGLGNPSSFGLLCVIGLAFCVFHPFAGRARWLLAILLAIGALQSKAMFALFAVALVAGIWMVTAWRRFFVGLLCSIVIVLYSVKIIPSLGDDGEIGFLEHKLKSAGAVVQLVEYDVDSSASISQRLEMHNQTFSAITAEPLRLLWGHLEGLTYWPMDSQLLTYLGSFGAPFVLFFILIHIYWTVCAWRTRHIDKGFSLVSLVIFGLIFTTNRILDYYPTSIIYFFIVASALRGGECHTYEGDNR